MSGWDNTKISDGGKFWGEVVVIVAVVVFTSPLWLYMLAWGIELFSRIG